MSGSAVEHLVAAARRGERQAVEALFGRAAKLSYARALKLLGDPDSAWDVAQDALVTATRELRTLRKDGAFFGWLRAIVDRTAIAHRERLARRRERPLAENADVRSRSPGPAEIAEARALADQARRAMERLPPRDRVMVELFYFEDMSCREVADFLRTTSQAVKTALHRSRAHMREEIITMGTATSGEPAKRPIVRTMSSGDDRGGRESGLLFEHDSPTARLYVELYPIGDARRAARALGMSEEELRAETAWLEARRLIAREGTLWRCTMPVMEQKDLEIIRPWAAGVAAPVTDALDDLHARLSTLAAEMASASARDTVIAVGLWAEVARRPFGAIAEAMKTSPTDRGEWGKCSVAAVSAQRGLPTGYGGGLYSGRWESDQLPGARLHYFLWPHGTDRSEMVSFARSLGQEVTGLDPGTGLNGFLCSLGCDPIAERDVVHRVGEFRLKVPNLPGFLADLERMHAILRKSGRVELAIPVVSHDRWQAFLDQLDGLGERIVEAAAGAADDLRERMLRCSFAECDFSDSVGICLSLAQDMVGDAILTRGWTTFPDRADFSWGTMFVC